MVIVFSEKVDMVDFLQFIIFLPKGFGEAAICEEAILQNSHAVKSGSILRDKFRREIWFLSQQQRIVNSNIYKGYFHLQEMNEFLII